MSIDQTAYDAELESLRERIDALEREHAEHTRKANAALAAAQDKSYWLERWHLDLNELMRRRGASEARAAVRAVRAVYRGLYNLRYQAWVLPLRVHDARRAVAEERALAKAGADDPFARELSPDPLATTPVTDVLYQRLAADDLAIIEAALAPAEAALWDAAEPAERRRLALAFAAHHNIEPALARAGLRGAMPPPEIHAIRRSPAVAGGSTYYADLIVDALAETGFDLSPGVVGLDFGCSSGRVVRILAAAYPELEWHGCDPLGEAIDWARANLPEISFERSPEHPPMDYGDETFDLVFAISVWSHFGRGAGLAWLDEMRRVLRPGGRLLVTTHGVQSLAYAAASGLREREQLETIERGLYRDGFWFTQEFGAEGDYGLRDADWGTAFLSPEWLLGQTSGRWRVTAFHPGRVEDNQDLYVLEPH
jgi:SAM-dependent methyltransferase